MKDKRLELKLSVRGDGSLSRNNLRSSVRSNRSNESNSSGLPVSEIFAIDRYKAPYNRPYFDILDKYRRPTQQFPAQSLQNINQYKQSRQNEYHRGNPYIDYEEPRTFARPQYPQYPSDYGAGYLRPFDPASEVRGTLPRAAPTHVDLPASGYYSLPARSSMRRVRIKELPTVYGSGMS